MTHNISYFDRVTVDHIFIFSGNSGAEADELVDFGLKEGSSRIHNGQGTTNRKFYFRDFFLEILWVHDQQEIQNERTKVTGLYERSNFEHNHYSPFGLCLVHTDDTDQIFANSSIYQPLFLPNEQSVDFISDPKLPWLFRLPFKVQKKATTEPSDHSKPLRRLLKYLS